MTIESLIQNIPYGHIRSAVGQVTVDGIVKYIGEHTQTSSSAEDIAYSVAIKNLHNLITKRDFRRKIKLFNDHLPSKEVEEILQSHTPPSPETSSHYPATILCEPHRPLHPFQERIRKLTLHRLATQSRLLIHMPTGSGKTRTACEILVDLVRLQPQRRLLKELSIYLWVAQSQELCSQGYDSIKTTITKRSTTNISLHRFWDGQQPTISASGTHIIVASSQTLSLNTNQEFFRRIANNCEAIIIDEAHRATAPTWRQPIDRILERANPIIIGLTATPGYASENATINHNIAHLFGSSRISLVDNEYNDISDPIQHLTNLGYLAKIQSTVIPNELNNPGEVHYDGAQFSFSTKLTEAIATHPTRNKTLVDIIKTVTAEGKSILVFSCSVSHNYILKHLLSEIDIQAEAIDANSNQREIFIERFKQGQLKVLVNYGVLTTGFDAPRTNACLIARPVGSLVEYSQMVGRILRGPLNTGNESNQLFTVKDNLGHGEYNHLFSHFNSYYHNA